MHFKKGAAFLFYLFLILLVIICGSFIGLFHQVKKQLPDLSALKQYEPNLITRVLSADGKSIAYFCLEKRILVPYTSLPKHLIQGTIAIEDARFYRHHGLDMEGVLRAALRNILYGHFAEGGSTITQQLTRSLILHPEKTIIRKAKEILLALELEKIYSKEKIIEMYLNQIYLGSGAYGVESASRTYFGKHVEDLTLPEAALIAGLPKAPTTYNPYRHPERALNRRDYVLKRMLEERYIDYPSYKRALTTPLELIRNRNQTTSAPYFVEYVRQYLQGKYGADLLYRGGLKVYTTLDLKAQQCAEMAIRQGLEELDKRHGFRKVTTLKGINNETKEELKESLGACKESGQCTQDILLGKVIEVSPSVATIEILGTDFTGTLNIEDASWTNKKSLTSLLHSGENIYIRIQETLTKKSGENNMGESAFKLALEQIPEAQGAFIALDPRTGYIKAMVGGYDFELSKFNRSIQARRQPGSAFKPFIYTTALKQGHTLADIFIDSPVIFQDESQEKWKPMNYGQKFFGPTTLRDALEKSINVITIKLLKEVGIEATIETARKMGINSPLSTDLSLALGSSGVSLLELTSAYGVFPANGIKTPPIAILKVEGPDGKILEENASQSETVLDEQTTYLMVKALQGVVEHGTGWKAKELGRPVAGKTGTTNNYIDAWFVGFTSDLVAGVWVGYDEYKGLGNGETGARAASPIWVEFMQKYLKGRPVKEFPVPSGIKFVSIDPHTGLLAAPESSTAFLEAFKEGTEPKQYHKSHRTRAADDFVRIDTELSKKALSDRRAYRR